jgi:hypothetical protein
MAKSKKSLAKIQTLEKNDLVYCVKTTAKVQIGTDILEAGQSLAIDKKTYESLQSSILAKKGLIKVSKK